MITDDQRAQRAQQGSRRKRDLTAARTQQLHRERERDRIPDDVRPASAAGTEAWKAVLRVAEEDLPRSTYRLWLAPLRLVGEHDRGLVVTGPGRVVTWVRRRYGKRLGDSVRAASDFRGVFVCDPAPQPEDSEDRCL